MLQDYSPNLNSADLQEFLCLWVALRAVRLDKDRKDKFVWMWEKNGCYSARSAYKAFFAGQTRAVGVKQIWRSRAPLSFLCLAGRQG